MSCIASPTLIPSSLPTNAPSMLTNEPTLRPTNNPLTAATTQTSIIRILVASKNGDRTDNECSFNMYLQGDANLWYHVLYSKNYRYLSKKNHFETQIIE